MVTYQKGLERKGWHRPWPVRAAAVVAGVVLVLIGLLAWSLEQDKGGWEGSGLGHFMVEQGGPSEPAIVRGESGEILFEADTIEEVDAWIESQRNRDFTVPIVMIVGGGLLIVVGVAPSPRKPDLTEPAPRVAVHA